MKLIKRFFELLRKSYSLLIKQLDDVILLTTFSVVFVILALVFLKDKGQSVLYDALGGFLGGTVGTVLSIMTVVLVYKTFRLQQKELNETKTILKIQRFEANFNNKLSIFRSISTDFDGRHGIGSALELIRNVYNEHFIGTDDMEIKLMKSIIYDIGKLEGKFAENLENNQLSLEATIEGLRIESLSQTELLMEYRNWTESYSKEHGIDAMERMLIEFMFNFLYIDFFEMASSQYFRYLFNLIQSVVKAFPDRDDEPNNKEERETYISQIQVNLSANELALLFYNCLTEYAVKKSNGESEFFNYVLEYNLVENVDNALLMTPAHKRFYSPNT
jgi:hypothetical protein